MHGVIRARVTDASSRSPVTAAASVYLSAGDTKKMNLRRADGSGSISGVVRSWRRPPRHGRRAGGLII
jgi:hypothetical protein